MVTALTEFVTPGPAVTTASPGVRVSRAVASAANTGGLLVPHVDQAHRGASIVLDHRVVEREHVPAGQREHHRYAVPPRGRHRVRTAMTR